MLGVLVMQNITEEAVWNNHIDGSIRGNREEGLSASFLSITAFHWSELLSRRVNLPTLLCCISSLSGKPDTGPTVNSICGNKWWKEPEFLWLQLNWTWEPESSWPSCTEDDGGHVKALPSIIHCWQTRWWWKLRLSNGQMSKSWIG